MKKILAAAAVATAMLGGSALPSMAASFISFPLAGVATEPVGPFTYDYQFTVPVSGYSIDGISASSSSTVSRTNHTANVSFSSVEIFGLFAPISVSGSGFNVYPGVIAPQGTYTLEIKGTVSAGVGAFNGNLSVSSVPLPTSVALFGMAVVGLGAVGARRRKGTAASATA